MCRLHVRTQPHPVTSAPQPHSQFDIFNRGTSIILVETTERGEHLATDGGTACPERGCLPTTALMNVVVQQVLVAGSQATRGRLGVVRTEHGGDVRMFGEVLLHARQGVGVDGHVGVEEYQDVCLGRFSASVAGEGRAAGRTADPEDPRTKSPGQFSRCIS